MSKRIAVLSIIALSFGVVSIPGGFIIDDVIEDLVYNNIDYALQEMRARAGPIAEPIVNATIVASALEDLVGFTGFFNDSAMPQKCGIAWYINQTYNTGDLNYSISAQNRILYGNDTGDPESP